MLDSAIDTSEPQDGDIATDVRDADASQLSADAGDASIAIVEADNATPEATDIADVEAGNVEVDSAEVDNAEVDNAESEIAEAADNKAEADAVADKIEAEAEPEPEAETAEAEPDTAGANDGSEDPATVWSLEQSLEDGAVQHVRIASSPFRVGRRRGMELRLQSPSISSHHAEILLREGKPYVSDRNSTNGTFVNGFRIEEETQLDDGDIVQFANICLRVYNRSNDPASQAPGVVATAANATEFHESKDQALGLARFSVLISERAVMPHFQPVVDLGGAGITGYELLGRSRLFGLTSPREMFLAAKRLDREAELSRMLRSEGVKAARKIPGDFQLFVNLHPHELSDLKTLFASVGELREEYPLQQISLEVHAQTQFKKTMLADLAAGLSDMNVGLVFDDFGDGHARLMELIELGPACVKFEKQFIQGAHKFPAGQKKRLSALIRMLGDVDITPLAKGVECEADATVCSEMGFKWAQGFYYGKPASVARFSSN